MKTKEAAGITEEGIYALTTSALGWLTVGVFTAWGLAAPRGVSHSL